LDEKTTNAFDKLLGLNTTAVVALGMAAGGLILAGSILGDYAHRLDAIERAVTNSPASASLEQCESVSQRLYDVRERVARLETWHANNAAGAKQ
jgi:hypothetical protein